MKALKFDPKSRIQPIFIIGWVAIAGIVVGGISQGIQYAAQQAEIGTEAPKVDPSSPEGLVGTAYDDLLFASASTRQELVKARAITLLQAANTQPQPIIWIRDKAIANEQALKAEVNSNLLWNSESVRRVSTLQFDAEAYGLLLKSLIDGSQSSITAAPDLLTLSKRVEALRGTWDVQFVERRFPNE